MITFFVFLYLLNASDELPYCVHSNTLSHSMDMLTIIFWIFKDQSLNPTALPIMLRVTFSSGITPYALDNEFLTCTKNKVTFPAIKKHDNRMTSSMHSRLSMLPRYTARCSNRYLMTMTFHFYLFSHWRELLLL